MAASPILSPRGKPLLLVTFCAATRSVSPVLLVLITHNLGRSFALILQTITNADAPGSEPFAVDARALAAAGSSQR